MEDQATLELMRRVLDASLIPESKKESVLKLVDCVLNDPPPPWKNVAGAYIFGQTSDNEISVLTRAKEIERSMPLDKRIFLCDGETDHGYPGFETWHRALLEQGVSLDRVGRVVTPHDQNINTLSEAESLIRLARHMKWQGIVIIAPPFHQLRAFMTTVSVASRAYPELSIYNQVGMPLDWSENVRHSQGTTTGTRREILRGEFDRIEKYQEKGDLLSPDEVLLYLNKRDASVMLSGRFMWTLSRN